MSGTGYILDAPGVDGVTAGLGGASPRIFASATRSAVAAATAASAGVA